MPPKRKQPVVEIVSEPELDDESEDELDINNSFRFIQKIEALAKKRNEKRRAITAGFDKVIAETKAAIEKHYASKAEKRSAEIKDLLTRRAQALQKQADIERQIETLLIQGHKSTQDIAFIIEAVHVHQGRKVTDNHSFLASLVPKRAIPAPSSAPIMTPPSVMHKRTIDLLAGSWKVGCEKERQVQSGSPTKDTSSQST